MKDNISKKEWVLLIPPLGDCTMPMLGPFLLSAFLKKNGVKVHVFDTSIQLLNDALDKNFIRIGGEIQKTSVEKITFLQHLADVVKKTTSDKLLRITMSSKILSVLSGTVRFTVDEAIFPFSINSKSQITRAISKLRWMEFAFESQPFWKYLSRGVNANVGISVSYSSQLPFALLLAEIIRNHFPKISIILGGAYFKNYDISLSSIIKACPYVDTIIIGSGEECLLQMAMGNKKQGGIIHAGKSSLIEYIPDFTGVRWNLYCVERGQRSIPFSLRTSCYYKQCAFCNGDNFGNETYNLDSAKLLKVLKSLRQICRKKVITNVYFTDAALSPEMLNNLATGINGAFHWGINARIDAGFSIDFFNRIHSRGCDMLRVGMETYSQKVLNLMNKGTCADNFERYFNEAHMAGIKLHVYIMYGFPGENDEDRYMTLRFLNGMKAYIYSYSISIFHAISGTPIYSMLEKKEACINKRPLGDINKLYYTEKSYKNVCSFIEKTVEILKTTHSNQYCYSGRIFQDVPEPPSTTIKFSVRLKSKGCITRIKQIFTSGCIYDNSKSGEWSFSINLLTDSCEISAGGKSVKCRAIISRWGNFVDASQQTVVQNNFLFPTKE